MIDKIKEQKEIHQKLKEQLNPLDEYSFQASYCDGFIDACVFVENLSTENYILYFKTGIVDKPLFIGSKEDCIIELNKILDKTDFQWQINEYPTKIIAFTKVCQGKVLLKEDVCPEFFNISKGFFYIETPRYDSLDIDHMNAVVLSNY